MPYSKNKYKGKNHWNYGRKPWNLGIPHSKESNEKNRLAHLGKKHTEEWKKKISNKLKGRKVTWGDKISEGKKGKQTSPETGFKPGENHWNWRGGVSQERELIANRSKERPWAKKVKKRDNWICQECGAKDGKMIAHHIIFWTPKAKSNYDLNNGKTLCNSCHVKLHWKLLKKRANSGKLLTNNVEDNPELNHQKV